MIVFDLACDNGHTFEGWFGSSDDFASQQKRGLLTCPVCESAAVSKAPMAPAVAAKGNRVPATPASAMSAGKVPVAVAEALKALAAAQSKALAQSEWVGDQFASRARSIHYGEVEDKPVHGRASRDDALSLIEEGIAIMPLLVPVHPPEELN